MEDLTGKQLGQYQVIAPLGKGGMATVYKAFDVNLERDVAIKLIRTDAFRAGEMDMLRKRFEREAKSLAKLYHPNIINVYSYGDYAGAPYLVMEYLQGGTLKDKLEAPMDPGEAAALLIPVAKALSHTHAEGIVHRDIKPANILIDRNGEPKLTDFGLARILEMSEGPSLTGTGVGIGTPDYMAPEQGMGGDIDHRTDIYALGVVLFEMVTGSKPYQADTPLSVLIKHINEPLPPPSDFVEGLPEVVDRVIIKAMEKQPENRYQSMAEFITALEGITTQDAADPEEVAALDEGAAHENPDPAETLPSGEETGKQDGKKGKVRIPAWIWVVLTVLLLLLCIRVIRQRRLEKIRQGTSAPAAALVASPTEVPQAEAPTASVTPINPDIPANTPEPTSTELPFTTPTPIIDRVSPIWAVSVGYQFEPNFWSIGTHEYNLVMVCTENLGELSNTLEKLSGRNETTQRFTVSEEAIRYPGYVFLRPGGLNTDQKEGVIIKEIHPSQPTIGVATLTEINYDDAELILEHCNSTISWDGGLAQELEPQPPFQP